MRNTDFAFPRARPGFRRVDDRAAAKAACYSLMNESILSEESGFVNPRNRESGKERLKMRKV